MSRFGGGFTGPAGLVERPVTVVRRLIAVCAAFLVGLASSAQAQTLPCRYDVTVLPEVNCGIIGNATPTPVAINNLGHVLSMGLQCGASYSDTWLWTGGPTQQVIPRPAGMIGFTGADLNDNGLICGTADFSGSGPRGVIYNTNNGQWTILPPLNPPNGWSAAHAINNAGETCGYRSIGSKTTPVNPRTAYWWSPVSGFHDFGMPDGRSTSARDLNSAGLVTVSSGSLVPGAFAYIWHNGVATMLTPPGCLSSEAGRVNALGMTTTGGIAQTQPMTTRAFVFHNGGFSECFPLPGATGVSFGGLSDAGLVAGRSNFGSASNALACVWSDSHVVDLNTMVPGFSGVLKYARTSGNGKLIVEGFVTGLVGLRVCLLTPIMPRVGDANCDEVVNVTDLLDVISHWGPCMGCRADFDADADVDVLDLINVILNWGTQERRCG